MILRADVASGGSRLVATDFRSSGIIPFVFRRIYDSTNRTEGSFGQGWRHGFEMSLEITSEEVICHGGAFDGERFAPVAPGKEGRQEESGFVLQHLPEGYILFASPDRQFVFMKSGARGNTIPLAAIRNQTGQSLRLEYAGRDLTGITDPEGRRLRLAYSGGRIQTLSIVGTTGEQPLASFTYSMGGQIASVTNAERATTKFTYDGSVLVEVAHPTGARQWAQYDEEFRCLALWDDSGRAFYLAHDPLRQFTRVVNAAGEQTIFQHVLGKQLIGETSHLAYSRNYYYDAINRPIGHGREDGLTERFEQYDPASRRMIVLDMEERAAFFDYDENNLLIGVEDAEEHRYAIVRNESGHTVRIITPAQHTWSFERDRLGRVQSLKTPADRALKIQWGATSREISDEMGLICRDTLDASGRVSQRMDALGRSTRFDYSPTGRLRKVDVAGQYGIDFLYDENGRLTGAVDTERNRYQIRRNAHGIIQGIETGGRKVDLAVTKTGQIVEFRSANQSLAVDYDEMRRPIEMLSESGAGKTIAYTSEGHKETGMHSENEYNRLDEIVSSVIPGNSENKFFYGVTGELLVWENRSARGETFVLFDYDSVGLPTRIQGHWYDEPAEVELAYTPDGLPSTLSLDDDAVLVCERDSRGQLSVVRIGEDRIVATYDSVGRLVQIGDLALEYDALDRPRTFVSQAIPVDGVAVTRCVLETSRIAVDCVASRTGVVLVARLDGIPIPLYWKGDLRAERIPVSVAVALAIICGAEAVSGEPLIGAEAMLDFWTRRSRWSADATAIPTGYDVGCSLDFLDSFFLDPTLANAHSERIPGQVSMCSGDDDLSVLTGPHRFESRLPHVWRERSATGWLGPAATGFVTETDFIESLKVLR